MVNTTYFYNGTITEAFQAALSSLSTDANQAFVNHQLDDLYIDFDAVFHEGKYARPSHGCLRAYLWRGHCLASAVCHAKF